MIVAIVGPECSGKTTLASELARRLGAPWVPEFARTYLTLTGRPGYDQDDLEQIARGQLAAERAVVGADRPLVVLDTDLIVIRVWWQEKYGRVPRWVDAELERQGPRRYLLTAPDLAWEPDPLRESPTDRERLLRVYETTLDDFGLPYIPIAGQGEARLRLAERAVAGWAASRSGSEP